MLVGRVGTRSLKVLSKVNHSTTTSRGCLALRPPHCAAQPNRAAGRGGQSRCPSRAWCWSLPAPAGSLPPHPRPENQLLHSWQRGRLRFSACCFTPLTSRANLITPNFIVHHRSARAISPPLDSLWIYGFQLKCYAGQLFSVELFVYSFCYNTDIFVYWLKADA